MADLFNLAVDLEGQVQGMMTALELVKKTLSQLTAPYPESLFYSSLGDLEAD